MSTGYVGTGNDSPRYECQICGEVYGLEMEYHDVRFHLMHERLVELENILGVIGHTEIEPATRPN